MKDFFKNPLHMFRKIYIWWKWEGRYFHRDIAQGVKNLCYWFPIIWKDRDWDQHYIFEVLKHKLKAQSKFISDYGIHTSAQQDARRIRLCISLIQKLQDETYAMEYMDYYRERVWFTDCEDRPGSFRYNSEDVWEKYDGFFKKYPLVYKRVLKGEGVFTLDGRDENDMKRLIAMNISKINHMRAKKLLFKIMEENIEQWWD